MNYVFFFCLIFNAVFIFYIFEVLGKNSNLKISFYYFLITFFFLLLFFLGESWKHIPWFFKIITSESFIFVLKNVEDGIFLYLQFCCFLSFFCLIPLFCFVFFYFCFNFWTLKEKIEYCYFVFILIYFFFIFFWIFFQDLGFSSWEIFKIKFEEKSFFLTFMDFQWNIEQVFKLLKKEFFDFFFWIFFLILFLNVLILGFQLNKATVHFLFILYILIGSYFFLGGDGFLYEAFIFSLTFIFGEFILITVYFFFVLEKKS